jgi:hypothetical protein
MTGTDLFRGAALRGSHRARGPPSRRPLAGPTGGERVMRRDRRKRFVIVRGVAVTVLSPVGGGRPQHAGEGTTSADGPLSGRARRASWRRRSELAILWEVFSTFSGQFPPDEGAPPLLLPPPPPGQRDDRGAGSPRREEQARALFPGAGGHARAEGGGRLVGRRPPLAAGDRRHNRLQPGDGLAHMSQMADSSSSSRRGVVYVKVDAEESGPPRGDPR